MEPIQTLEASFSQRDMTGWIIINLRSGQEKKAIWASYAFPPFGALLDFLKHVKDNELPYSFSLDEEGIVTQFVARPKENEELFEFVLLDKLHPEKIYISGIFNRIDFVREVIQKLKTFLNTEYDDKKWRTRLQIRDLRDMDLEAFESFFK